MITKHTLLGIIAVMALLLAAPPSSAPQDCFGCRPAYSSSELAPDNVCAGTGSRSNVHCSGSITKFVRYSVWWPDGSSTADERILQARGQSDSAETCNRGLVVGAPYKYRECWPPFYTPVTSKGRFVASAYNASAYGILDPYGCSSGGVSIPYVYAIGCNSPVAPLSVVEVTHNCWCAGCPTDNCLPDIDSGCHGPVDTCMYPYNGGCPSGEYFNGSCCCPPCPIIIDVDGNGFSLTSPADGVDFDFFGSGKPVRLGWTAPESDDAFLVLDLDGNGTIDSGKELFGNITPQPDSAVRNGFSALSVYDRPDRGGNGDGVIDDRDAIFTQLRLWQDANHNGVSEPGELHTLASLGIQAIHFDYKVTKKTDEYGNAFRYRAKVDSSKSSQIPRWAWDVIFTHK